MYYTANNQKIADKKKTDYQDGLEKSRADSAARSRDSYMKDPEKSCVRSRESDMKNQEKRRADSATRSRESYKNDLEKSHDDSAAQSRDIGVGSGGLEHRYRASVTGLETYHVRSLRCYSYSATRTKHQLREFPIPLHWLYIYA